LPGYPLQAVTFFQKEGTHTTTVKEGGAWKLIAEGKFQYIGGTGKFKNIKGNGAYKGRVPPAGGTTEAEGVILR